MTIRFPNFENKGGSFMRQYAYVFQGTAFSSKSFQEVNILKDFIFCINEDGIIEKMVSPDDEQYSKLLSNYEGKENFHRLKKGRAIFAPRIY